MKPLDRDFMERVSDSGEGITEMMPLFTIPRMDNQASTLKGLRYLYFYYL